jgi:hypothetical protein
MKNYITEKNVSIPSVPRLLLVGTSHDWKASVATYRTILALHWEKNPAYRFTCK